MPMRPEWLPRTLIVIAAGFSLAVMLLLKMQGLSAGPLLLVAVSSLIWGLALWLSRLTGQRRIRMVPLSLVIEPLPIADPLSQYFDRLLGSLDQSWHLFRKHFRHTQQSLHNVQTSLARAVALSRNTGMLAVNAMMTAAGCGEVGRGFVTVSQDLIDISERSEIDLQRLQGWVRGLNQDLAQLEPLLDQPAEFWVVTRAGLPLDELMQVRARLAVSQQNVRTLAERYRRTPQLDVRWLQLGDAVKRLLSELTNTLFQLELNLDDVLSDMRLLRLAEGSASGQQIVEIKDRIHSAHKPGGHTQKIIP